ncbi:hypothetical protein BHE74_00012035, partial [Ensete ventricosum]
VVFQTLLVENFEEHTSEEGLQANLDLLEEQRVEAHLRALACKKVMAKLYNQKVGPQQIKVGDLVLRKAKISDPAHAQDKLTPNLEGPY